jgi:hypothetical protein
MARLFWRAVALLSIALSFPIQRGMPAEGFQLSAASLETFNGCGMEGDATKPAVKALNRLKNRYTAPGAGEVNSVITLAAILAPGDDVGRWKVKYGAESFRRGCAKAEAGEGSTRRGRVVAHHPAVHGQRSDSEQCRDQQ